MVPDPSLTLAEGVIAPFKTGNYYPQVLRAVAKHVGTDADTPWEDMPKKAPTRSCMAWATTGARGLPPWTGRDTYWYIEWEGAWPQCSAAIPRLSPTLSARSCRPYFATVPCETCSGKRTKPEGPRGHGERQVHPRRLSAAESLAFFEGCTSRSQAAVIALPIVKEITRAAALPRGRGPGLPRWSGPRPRSPGGEAQRIRLAPDRRRAHGRALHSDEPSSIGFTSATTSGSSPRWSACAILGNTVVVVEHDEETIRAADFVVDMGPGAGEHGGHVMSRQGRRPGHGHGNSSRPTICRGAAASRGAGSSPQAGPRHAMRTTCKTLE